VLRRTLSTWLWPVLGLCLVLGVWQYWAAEVHPDSLVLPTPTSIASWARDNFSYLCEQAWATLKVVLIGFAIAVGGAAALAIIFDLVPILRKMFLPLLVVTQVTPTIAVAPLLVIGLGFGAEPKIAVVILISFFPVLIGTLTGLQEVPRDLRDLSRASRANKWRSLRYIALPNALPYFLSGTRVGITLSVIGAVVGEFIASDRGLGYVITQGSAQIRPEQMWAGVLGLAVIGVALFNAVRVVEWVVMPWRRR
jgi:NitT/TauT family transport system permease protein